ncbi:MAG: efflux RND transporter periplasmic adaptor subunit [bacterium]
MKKVSKSFFNFIISHKVWSSVIVLAIIIIAWSVFKNSSENIKYTETIVTKGSISEIVSVTGNVKPLSAVDLAFELGGRVASINVAVGDRVYVGENLASVSNADLIASLDQARANLKKVQAGTGDNADKTALDLTQAENSLVDAIKDSYTKADDAVRNKMYSLFVDPARYGAKLNFTADSFLRDDIEKGKDTVSDSLISWNRSIIALNNTSDLDSNYNLAKTNLLSIKALLDKCAEAVNSLDSVSDYTTQAQIDTWKLNISTARTNINTTINSLTGFFDQYKTAGLSVKISGNSTLAEEAGIEQAQASVAGAEAALAKSIIKSPIGGVITNINPKLGEIIPSGKSVLSIISYGDYEVEVFVPEADIAKVKIGNLASTTLDAYGSGINFETQVIKIDPAATVIDGVPTYKVTLKFTNKDERIRSGMTANLDILANYKDGVLVLPSRVITTKDDGKYVSILDSTDLSELIEKKIITGARDSNGTVEIVSGLNEGDKVVTPL